MLKTEDWKNRKIRGTIKTVLAIQTWILLRSAWILWRVLETCSLSGYNERPPVKLVWKTRKEWNDYNLDLAGGPEKLWNMKLTVMPVAIGTLGEAKRKNRDQLDHSTVKIIWNTEKIPGVLGSPAVIKTSMKNDLLKLVGKTHRA